MQDTDTQTAVDSGPQGNTSDGDSDNPDRPRRSWWSRLFGRKPASVMPATTTRTTSHMVQLRTMPVVDVAVPKAEIIAIDASSDLATLIDVFRDSGLTRLPVYEETLDQPIGMVHLKDLALKHGFNNAPEEFDLASLVRPLLFVPPSMPVGVLLTKMQAERRHMALIIDEYGGTDGLVTIEDLIEQVVGDIEDEHDVAEDLLWKQEKPGCWQVSARAPLTDLEAELNLSLTGYEEIDAEEVDTMGGLIFVMSGQVPARGQIIEHPSGASFEIVEADPRRVKRIRIRLPNSTSTNAQSAAM